MNRTICITGANRGLGLALAIEVLKAGDTLVSLSRHRPESAEIRGKVTHYTVDVTDEPSVKAAADEIAKKFGKVDVFINNAAIYPMPLEQDLEKLTSEDLQGIIEMAKVNAFAPVLAARYFIPLLRKGNDKLLVNISSEAGSISQCGRTEEYGYCMSKAALNMAVKILHNRYRKEGFRVFAVQPGWMRTDMGGPDACLGPEESAKAIMATLAKKNAATEDIFFDKDGNRLDW